jgi:hypothetical protein
MSNTMLLKNIIIMSVCLLIFWFVSFYHVGVYIVMLIYVVAGIMILSFVYYSKKTGDRRYFTIWILLLSIVIIRFITLLYSMFRI